MDSGKARSRRDGGVLPLFSEKRDGSPRPSATPLINEGGKILAPAFSAACTDGCFAEATKKFLFPISFLLNSILWKTLVFSTGMC